MFVIDKDSPSADKVQKFFEQLRFNNSHHLGLGDIRLTMSQQDALVKMIEVKSVSVNKSIEELADELACKHITDKFGDPHKHWCFDNIYKAILFTLKELGASDENGTFTVHDSVRDGSDETHDNPSLQHSSERTE